MAQAVQGLPLRVMPLQRFLVTFDGPRCNGEVPSTDTRVESWLLFTYHSFRLLRLMSENLSLRISRGKQIDDSLNGGVSFVESGLEVGGGYVELSGCAVEETVG